MLYRLRAFLLGTFAAAILLASSSFAEGSVKEVSQKKVSAKRAQVVSIAKQYLGRDYSYGASGPWAFDCSGFTRYVYGKVGISLPHNAAAQESATRKAHGKLRRGDLLFMYGNGHVGIYIGKKRFIHASSARDEVIISRMSGWYRAVINDTGRVLTNATLGVQAQTRPSRGESHPSGNDRGSGRSRSGAPRKGQQADHRSS